MSAIFVACLDFQVLAKCLLIFGFGLGQEFSLWCIIVCNIYTGPLTLPTLLLLLFTVFLEHGFFGAEHSIQYRVVPSSLKVYIVMIWSHVHV